MERRWKVLAVVSVATFMASLDLFIVNIAFPDLARDFPEATRSDLSWVLNAYAIVFAALLVPAGRLADRIGRRRGFLAGLTLFAIGSALCGVAPSVPALVAARVLQAAGGALLMPTSLALLLPEFAGPQRAAAIGIWAAVGGVAAALGPPLGGLLVEASWRLVFLVNLPVALGALVYAARILRESRDPDSGPWPDLAGTSVLVLGVAVLALGLVQAPEWGWGSARTLACLAAALVALAVFWRRCRTHPSPVIDPEILRVRSFAMANTAQLLFAAGFAAMLLESVLLLTDVWGDSVLRAGFSVSPGPLLAATFAVIAGRLGGRIEPGLLASAGCALFAVAGVWWLARVGPVPDYAGEVLPGLLISGVGVGLTLPSLASAAAVSLPPARFATGSAVLTMSRQLGFVLGVSVLVAALGTPDPSDPLGGFDAGFAFIAVSALAASIAATRIGRVLPATQARVPEGATEPALEPA